MRLIFLTLALLTVLKHGSCEEETPQTNSRIRVNGKVGKNVKVRGTISDNFQINGKIGDNVLFAGNIGKNVQINGHVEEDVKFGGDIGDNVQINGTIKKDAQLMGAIGDGVQINGAFGEGCVYKTAMASKGQFNGRVGNKSVISGNLMSEGTQFNGRVADGVDFQDSLPAKHQFYGEVRALDHLKASNKAANVLVLTNIPYPSEHLVLHVPVKDKEKYSKSTFWDAIETPKFKLGTASVSLGKNVHFYRPVKGTCEFKESVGDDVIFEVEIPDGHVFTKAIPSRSRVVDLNGSTKPIDFQPGTKNLPSNSATSVLAIKSLALLVAAFAVVIILA